MKIALITVGVLVGLMIGVIVVGAMLPKHHTVTRSATFRVKPAQLFALISGPPTWRPDVKKYEPLASQSGLETWQETDSHGQTIAYEVLESNPPALFRTRIATPNLPYGGTWTYALHAEGGKTTVSITEDGDVYNPVFRFVSRFFVGDAATITAYLANLRKAERESTKSSE